MYDGYMTFNGVELFNVSRTATIAEFLGIDSVWVTSESVDWVRQKLGGTNYHWMSNAPWYDAGFPPSSQFAGVLPLSVTGTSDSTSTSAPIEYITDGGAPGRARSATKDFVVTAALVGSTEQGVDYGLRWLGNLLQRTGNVGHHTGVNFAGWRAADPASPSAYYRDVKLTRGVSVTRKRSTDCSVIWFITFTLNAADPIQYGSSVQRLSAIGNAGTAGAGIISSGVLDTVQLDCVTPSYDPIFDPQAPALIAPPTSLSALPYNWPVRPGVQMWRWWARVSGLEPTDFPVAPVITLTSSTEKRGARVGIWEFTGDAALQCDPAFGAVFAYIPPGTTLVLDGRTKTVYRGGSIPRRAESVVYGWEGGPLQWNTLKRKDPANPNGEWLIGLDGLSGGGTSQNLTATVNFVPIYG